MKNRGVHRPNISTPLGVIGLRRCVVLHPAVEEPNTQYLTPGNDSTGSDSVSENDTGGCSAQWPQRSAQRTRVVVSIEAVSR